MANPPNGPRRCRITVTLHLEVTATQLLATLAPVLTGLGVLYLR